jgi:hypothetical protein
MAGIKCLKSSEHFGGSVELSRPSALGTRLMHFPFENWIQDIPRYFRINDTVLFLELPNFKIQIKPWIIVVSQAFQLYCSHDV